MIKRLSVFLAGWLLTASLSVAQVGPIAGMAVLPPPSGAAGCPAPIIMGGLDTMILSPCSPATKNGGAPNKEYESQPKNLAA